ncbi:hypothetical protein ABEG63_00395 [Chryseobacterium sp. C39-AII1]|uniref:hypothetical protein n=1 Tax=Chryseobacterium sp. C39-AII1 TaxID=3080332 RepID=UPI003207A0D7
MSKIIKIGYLLSYDYKFIFKSLELVYDEADDIVISYDKNNKTWSGNDISIPEYVFDEIKNIDRQNKIRFYADEFYIGGHTPMELETRQRNLMGKFMGKGGWHLQIDSDEYPYDFRKLSNFLRKCAYLTRKPEKTPFNFLINWVVLFKQNENGFFVVQPFNETCFMVTNSPQYTKARMPQNDRTLFLDYYVIHQSWARTESEILQKVNNWGHVNDFDVEGFFHIWKTLNKNNYTNYKNFHPLSGSSWENIEFFNAKDIDEFLLKFKTKYPQKKLYLNISFTKKIKLYLKSLF